MIMKNLDHTRYYDDYYIDPYSVYYDRLQGFQFSNFYSNFIGGFPNFLAFKLSGFPESPQFWAAHAAQLHFWEIISC